MKNLDCIDKSDLMSLWIMPGVESIIIRENISLRIATLYKSYAVRKHAAIVARSNGQIKSALQYESQCDGIYNILPKKEQW